MRINSFYGRRNAQFAVYESCRRGTTNPTENIFVVLIIIHCCSAQIMGNLLCLSNPGVVSRPSSSPISERTNHVQSHQSPLLPTPLLPLLPLPPTTNPHFGGGFVCALVASSMPPLSSPLPTEMREEEPMVEEVLWVEEKEGRIHVVSTP